MGKIEKEIRINYTLPTKKSQIAKIFIDFGTLSFDMTETLSAPPRSTQRI